MDDQLSCLASVRRHLAPGGRFGFDVFNPDLGRLATPTDEEDEDTPLTQLPGQPTPACTARVVSLDRMAQVSQVEITDHVTDAAGREAHYTQTFPMRWHFRFELEHRSRARVSRWRYREFDRASLSQESADIIVVAKIGE